MITITSGSYNTANPTVNRTTWVTDWKKKRHAGSVSAHAYIPGLTPKGKWLPLC